MNHHETQNKIINFLGLTGRKIRKLSLELEAHEVPLVTIEEYIDLPNSPQLEEKSFELFLREKIEETEQKFNLDRDSCDIETRLKRQLTGDVLMQKDIVRRCFGLAKTRASVNREEWHIEKAEEGRKSGDWDGVSAHLRGMDRERDYRAKI